MVKGGTLDDVPPNLRKKVARIVEFAGCEAGTALFELEGAGGDLALAIERLVSSELPSSSFPPSPPPPRRADAPPAGGGAGAAPRGRGHGRGPAGAGPPPPAPRGPARRAVGGRSRILGASPT